MKRVVVLIVVALVSLTIGFLSGCGYDGYYRYPCQNPANFELSECKPPMCNYNDQCSVDLIGGINEA
jgi:hypothetical protein